MRQVCHDARPKRGERSLTAGEDKSGEKKASKLIIKNLLPGQAKKRGEITTRKPMKEERKAQK